MVNNRDVPITLDELHEKLLNHENTLSLTVELAYSSMPVTANAAQYSNQLSSRGNYRGSNQSRGNYSGSRSYLGKCQFYGTQGHNARRCPQLITQSAPPQCGNTSSCPAPSVSLPPPHCNPQHYHMRQPLGYLTAVHRTILRLILAISPCMRLIKMVKMW